MKKANKIILGATALVVAFSSFAFTACSGNNEPDGTIDGNYQEATAEEVNAALSNVNSQTLYGDPTADGYKFGVELSSNLNLTATSESTTNSAKMNADYKLLIAEKDGALTTKGEGNLTINTAITPAEGEKTTNGMSINLWQDDAVAYVSMTVTSSEDEEGAEPKSSKIKFDVSEIVSALIPSDGTDANDVVSDSTTSIDLSKLDLVAAVNTLNELGATASMDTSNGVKLKISVTEEVVNNLISQMTGKTTDELTQLISFSKCSLDFYLSIDRNGMLDATSIVADVEVSVKSSATATSASTVKLNGYLYFEVNANVTPTVPESLKTDLTYIDVTDIIGSGIIGGGIIV
ncbi:MAG: hypothetical protein ACI4MN_00905 [Candidatus Coproplasma sp.]